MDTGRLAAFSDGVFAVAITLLVLDLKVDGPGHGALLHQLGNAWPEFAAYLTSFLVVGIIWVNHHGLFSKVVAADRTLLFLNLGLLMTVAVIPFPTLLLAQYLRLGGTDAKVAAVMYGVVMELMGLAFTGIHWWMGREEHLLHPSVVAAEHRASFNQFALGAVAYLVTILVALVSAPAALALHFALAVFYVFDRTSTRGPQTV